MAQMRISRITVSRTVCSSALSASRAKCIPNAAKIHFLSRFTPNHMTTDIEICAQIADLAEMARQPLVADRMVEFLRRSNALLTKVIAG